MTSIMRLRYKFYALFDTELLTPVRTSAAVSSVEQRKSEHQQVVPGDGPLAGMPQPPARLLEANSPFSQIEQYISYRQKAIPRVPARGLPT